MQDQRRYWVNAPLDIPDLFESEDFEAVERGGFKRIDTEFERAGFFIQILG
ncbi:MAG: hypothetical protein IMF19_08255 [Proteobacteria bacterium]|jgi:hypothetical protein|nr:hypothetical protein [Pseudomonadota bacterium]